MHKRIEDLTKKEWDTLFPIELEEFNPKWKNIFEEERQRIKGKIGDQLIAIEHVGSTSIPNIKAKSYIDISIEIGDTYVVFDLSTRFQVSEETEARYLLIIGHSEVKAGLQLPLLPSTFKVDGKSISSEMNMIEDASLDVSYIKGIIQYEEKLIYYLDIIEMLQSDKAVVVPDKILAKEG